MEETVMNMELIFPTIEHKQAVLEYRQEWLDKEPGERINGSWGLQNQRYENYGLWLSEIENLQINPMPNINVPASTYFAFINDKIVGNIQIRHALNEELIKSGGHIGYSVRPSERRKGYATQMLTLALQKCRELGIEKVLVSCDKDNIASAKTILKNGGILENEIVEDDGNILQRYWITL